MHDLIVRLSIFMLVFSGHVYAEELRMSPDVLNKNINNQSLLIIDVRSKIDYDIKHIPNALNFPVTLTYVNSKIDGQIQIPTKIQTYFRERGIDTSSHVVVYDDGKLIDAARVFWMLEVYGLTHVKILNQGFEYWLSKGFPTSDEEPKIKPSNYIATIRHDRLSSKFTTQLAIYNTNIIVIDARSSNAYEGEVSVAKRYGHILSAINIPFDDNLTFDSDYLTLKSIEDLKKLYSSIPKGKKIITYCKIGRISSTNYFALRELGYDVSNYDASWREWGNDSSLPIE